MDPLGFGHGLCGYELTNSQKFKFFYLSGTGQLILRSITYYSLPLTVSSCVAVNRCINLLRRCSDMEWDSYMAVHNGLKWPTFPAYKQSKPVTLVASRLKQLKMELHTYYT